MKKNTIRRTPLIGAGLIGLLLPLVTGCGGDAAGADNPSTGASSAAGGSDGGAADLGDFPVPAPPGGTVGRVISKQARMITYDISEFDAIVEFYDEWLAETGFKSPIGTRATMALIESSGQATTQAWSDDEYYNIIATPDGGEVFLGITVHKK